MFLPSVLAGSFETQFAHFVNVWGAVIAIGLSWVGYGIYRWQRRREWRSKTFMRQVNFSLNEVRDDTLVLRTLIEDTADNVFLSDVAVTRVLSAARGTTKDNPFVAMNDDADHSYMMRAVLNIISTRYSEAYLSRAMGNEVETKTFVFGLTCEVTENVITQKLRVMLIEEELLTSQFGPEGTPDELNVVVPTHVDRIKTLKKMAQLYLSNEPSEKRFVSTLELGLPKGLVA